MEDENTEDIKCLLSNIKPPEGYRFNICVSCGNVYLEKLSEKTDSCIFCLITSK